MPPKKRKTVIQILNPIQGSGFTSLEHARRYVRQGRAEWAGPAIRFINPTRNAAAKASKSRLKDGDGFASLAAVEGLPVAGDAIRLFTGHRPATPPIDYGEPVLISTRALLLSECLI